ncbi:hypothetical protein BC828DRAFT_375992 [Blastocladiella britannica]|nr:hypothetical protein BC828DRAFT_375992 [Blastocladiella britannica]
MKITLTVAAVAALAAQASATMAAKYTYLMGVTPITQTCSDRGQVAADFPVVFPSPKSKVSYTVHFGTDPGNIISVPRSLIKLRTTVVRAKADGSSAGRKISYVAGSRVARHVLTKAPADILAAGASMSTPIPSAQSYGAAQLYANMVGNWFTYKQEAVHAPTIKSQIAKAVHNNNNSRPKFAQVHSPKAHDAPPPSSRATTTHRKIPSALLAPASRPPRVVNSARNGRAAAATKKQATGSSKPSSALVSSLSLVRAAAKLAKAGPGNADETLLKEAAAVMAAFYTSVTTNTDIGATLSNPSLSAIGPFRAVVEGAKSGNKASKQWATAVYDFTSYILTAPDVTKVPASQHTIKVITPQTNMAPVKALTEHKALVQSSVLVPRRHPYSNNPACTAIHNPTSTIAIGKVKISTSALPSKNAPFQFATTIRTRPSGVTEKAVADAIAGKNSVDITQTFRFKVMPGCNAGGIEPVAFVSAATCYPREPPKMSVQEELEFAIADAIEEVSADEEEMSMDDEEAFAEDE